MIKKLIKSAGLEAACLLLIALLAAILIGLAAAALVLIGALSAGVAASVGIICGATAAGLALGASVVYKVHDRFFPDREFCDLPKPQSQRYRALHGTSLGLCAAGTIACGMAAGMAARQIPLVQNMLDVASERGSR